MKATRCLGLGTAWLSLALALPLAALPQEGAPIGIARLRLEGPSAGARLEAGGPPTLVRAELAAGEVLTLGVPLERHRHARPGAPAPGELVLTPLPGPAGGGGAHLVGWDPEPAPPTLDGGGPLERPLQRLARRTRPPLALPGPRPAPSDLALLGALLLGGLALARRPLPALALGLAGAGLLLLLPGAAPGPVTARVLEGDLAAGAWLEVRSGLDQLALEPGTLAPPSTRPEGCGRSYRVDAAGAGGPGERGRVRWWALGPGCELSVAVPRAAPALDLRRNDFERLDPLWIREPDGRWARHLAWEPGAPPPPRDPSTARRGAPPAWLAAALPQGRGVLVAGRPSPTGQPLEGQREGRASAGDWVRVVGP